MLSHSTVVKFVEAAKVMFERVIAEDLEGWENINGQTWTRIPFFPQPQWFK